MCNFADMLGLKYSYYVNENRFHGFNIPASKLKGFLVISSDFGITAEEVENLVDNDVVLLSTDHHECQDTFIDIKKETAEGIVINNQYPFEPEEDRYLSGAGVFFELICSLYSEFDTAERRALVGITLLSDVRQIENKKARQYLKTTYTMDTSCGYVKYLIDSTVSDSFNFGTPKLDRNFIDYTLNPCINALLRADKTNEAIKFILGEGLSLHGIRDYQRSIQELIQSRMHVLKMNNLHVISINAMDFLDINANLTNYVGYVCGKYKDENHGVSTLGFVYENGKILRTSFRGKYDDITYRTSFLNIGLKARGHKGAFGLVDFKPTEETWITLDDIVSDLEAEHSNTATTLECSNLGIVMVQKGMKIATENCYVRDMYRTYIKYTGKNAKIVKQTYKMAQFTQEDYTNMIKPDKIINGNYYKYLLDANNNPIPKYIEYLIDGRKVKSFGVSIENGVIMPMLDKGYISLYIKSPLN